MWGRREYVYMMEINKLFQQKVDWYNNSPMESFDGFSPFQMSFILSQPYNQECPIKINSKIEQNLLNDSPIFKILLSLLTRIEDNDIKLTATDNLPPQIVKDIYNLDYYPDVMIEKGITKLTTEKDWIILHTAKIVLIQAGILRKIHRKLLFTKKGMKCFEDQRFNYLFYIFLRAFTIKFNWAYNDGYENEQIGQLGFLYSLYLLNKYGDTYKELRYYGDLYFKAFPVFKSLRRTGENDYHFTETAFYTRFVGRFCKWFGFVDIQNSLDEFRINHKTRVKKTPLLLNLFK
jgi:hypothetical protein